MLKPEIFVGLRMEVRRGPSFSVYVTRVEDVSVTEFAIGLPVGNNSLELFRPGEEVSCCFGDKHHHALWGFKTHVLRREVQRIPLYYLNLPDGFEKVQRRNFYRWRTIAQAKYRMIGDSHWQTAFVIDISAGGARVSHRNPLSYLDMVEISFSLPKTELHFILQGRVVRVEQVDSSGVRMYNSGIEFVHLPIGTQDRLVGYVFARISEAKRIREE